jgi:lantibiotic biosynthesis protein
MADDFSEITLTSELIGELAGGAAAGSIRVPPRAEIVVEVRAESLAVLDLGRFTLAMTGAPRPASSMIGRHAWLLPAADRDLLAGTFSPASCPAP